MPARPASKKKSTAQKPERVIATAQDLRNYTKEPKHDDEVAVIYGLFLWASYHVTKHGRDIIYLHFYDAIANDTVDDLLKTYVYDGERNFNSDKELMTATIWDEVGRLQKYSNAGGYRSHNAFFWFVGFS
ncbi:hypothetical protein V7S43_014439 [Phytophthora oleae]|uniref:Uncharacterized protein n=1 Tax=Phytophthora oleae TaxID=2107226 RepID=A0ABD3F5G6_9STRA